VDIEVVEHFGGSRFNPVRGERPADPALRRWQLMAAVGLISRSSQKSVFRSRAFGSLVFARTEKSLDSLCAEEVRRLLKVF
jgi:hypothetical protein